MYLWGNNLFLWQRFYFKQALSGSTVLHYQHIYIFLKKKKCNNSSVMSDIRLRLNNLLPHLHALVHSGSGLYPSLLFTWHQFICNKRIAFIQNPTAGCMQHSVGPRCNNSVYLGENWKLLEVWQQLIRCCHCRALTTKSKQCSFKTTGMVKYWGGDTPAPLRRKSRKCFGSMITRTGQLLHWSIQFYKKNKTIKECFFKAKIRCSGFFFFKHAKICTQQ